MVIPDLFSKQAECWSPSRFSREWPEREVGVVVDLPPDGVPYKEKSTDYQKRMNLADFVPLLYSGKACYLNQAPIREFPELDAELDVGGLQLGQIFAINLWLGSRTRSGLHFDNADNLFGQIYGKKRALLVSPVYTKLLYPFANNPSKSRLNPDAPDYSKFPKSKKIEVWSCDLNPGEALYIPRGWWHHITAEEISLSINCWHGNSLTSQEYTRMCLGGGWRIFWRTAYDFVWHGVLGRPYQPRLFSPPPLGIDLYNKINSKHRRHDN